jgi:hypothetical protein
MPLLKTKSELNQDDKALGAIASVIKHYADACLIGKKSRKNLSSRLAMLVLCDRLKSCVKTLPLP